MKHNYTRQRQGRDFYDHNKSDEKKQSALTRLKEYQEYAEQAATPIDGNEPERETPAPEKAR